MNKKINFTWQIVIVALGLLIAAIAGIVIFHSIAGASQEYEEGTICTKAELIFSKSFLTLKYCDGSEEKIHRHYIPEAWKKRLTLDREKVTVKKSDYLLDDMSRLYLIISPHGCRLQFFARSNSF